MKVDPYHSDRTYKDWKEETESVGISGLSKTNCKLLLEYINDMETGQNIARGSKKGARSYTRLNALRVKLIFLFRTLEERGIHNSAKTKEKEINSLFDDMRKGVIKKINGETYKSVGDYVKDFKSFWHWLIKVNKKKDIEIQDITEDLDTSKEENTFVYFTKDELEKMLPYFTPDEQTMMLFMFDTIIRSPTELMNVRISDVASDLSEATIRDETSKTYGRTIKLLLCKDALKEYLKRNSDIKSNEYLFQFSAPYFNRKLKKVSDQVFEGRSTKGGKSFAELSMYDFRHSGACHWRTGAYRSKIDALMYRGGWSNLEMLNYYTKKLGMKDSIEKDDLLVGLDKTELEKEIDRLKRERDYERELNEKKMKVFEEKLNSMETRFRRNLSQSAQKVKA